MLFSFDELKCLTTGMTANFDSPITTIKKPAIVAQSARLNPSGSQVRKSPLAKAVLQIVYIDSWTMLLKIICTNSSLIVLLVGALGKLELNKNHPVALEARHDV